jgi:hypothetical protein
MNTSNRIKAFSQPGIYNASSKTKTVSKDKVQTVIGNLNLNSINFEGSDRIVWVFDPDSTPGTTSIKFKTNIESNIKNKNSSVQLCLYRINPNECKKMFYDKTTKSGNRNIDFKINIDTPGNPVYMLIMQWNLKGNDKAIANDVEFKLSDSLQVVPKGKSKFGASGSGKTMLYLIIALIVAFFAYKMYKKKKSGFGKRR